MMRKIIGKIIDIVLPPKGQEQVSKEAPPPTTEVKAVSLEHKIKKIYKDCLTELKLPSNKMKNQVSQIYSDYSDYDISNQIAKILKEDDIKADIQVIFQPVKNLHLACPKNLGDWYFTGNYPTPGGNKVVNQAFVNYYEGSDKRAY